MWSRDLKGHDPRTGKVVRALVQEMTGPMSHDRCYRNRITHRHYLNSATGGSDFVKLDGTAESPNPWARSTCGLAVMPANGMLYNGPYVCQCAIATMATGVNGFYNGSDNTDRRFNVKIEPRLIKGPAFGDGSVSTAGNPTRQRGTSRPQQSLADASGFQNNEGTAASPDDWPTYRYSSMRSGVSPGRTPEELATRWKVDIGAHPTAPVVAGDSVYVADRDGYTVYSLDRDSGETRWSFITDSRIDSPPTYYKGMILVGSRGGSVYALGASDGQLFWKFNGMPQRRLICDRA